MDADLEDRARRAAEVHALVNALTHDEDAQPGAVMGPIMGENPALREHPGEVKAVVEDVVASVNAMTPGDRRDRLRDLDPDALETLDEEDDVADDPDLPALPNVEAYDEVRMRVAPNPNGPWHLGHARMPAVIGTYKERYDGWFACRFDDTDPETKRPDLDAYDQILADIEYLGFEPDRVLRASDRLETYYEHARDLIDRGGAYTCSCPADEFSDLKNAGEPCEHRDADVDTVRAEFEAMVTGEVSSGDRVLRVRTDITHDNPALRDWVAFRMVDTPHPRSAAADYRCWPMLDFQSAIDDHLLDVTHVIRGIDLQDSARRQGFVYDYFGWSYPEVVHWGHVQVDEYDVRLSTSRIRESIEDGTLDGWDDPRAPTLMSVRRRGIEGAAVTGAMVELGTSTSNVELAMSSIYSRNRSLIDDTADRVFLVRDDVAFPVIGGPEVGHPPVHPEHEDRGDRTLPVTEGVRIEADDVPGHGERVWLKGFGCVRLTRDALEWVGDDIAAVREEDVPVIHWVPRDDTRPVTLRTVTGDVDGVAEPGLDAYAPNDLVQFERVGYARIDAVDDATVAFFAHP